MFLSTEAFFFLSRIVKDIAMRPRRTSGQKKKYVKDHLYDTRLRHFYFTFFHSSFFLRSVGGV